jgi:uncharacterized protein
MVQPKLSIDRINSDETLWELFDRLRQTNMGLSNEQLPEHQAFMPFWDLFGQLRQAGMKLTIDDYDLFRRSLASGFGFSSWEELADLCRLLWVKPSQNYDIQVFDREFAKYRSTQAEKLERLWQQRKIVPSTEPPAPTLGEISLTPPLWQQRKIVPSTEPPAPTLGEIPLTPPPRNRPEPEGTPEEIKKPPGWSTEELTNRRSAEAVKSRYDRPSLEQVARFAIKIPIPAAELQRNAANFPRALPEWSRSELDIEATVDRISREGIYCDEVKRPLTQKKVNLLLLMDDSNAMRPFSPATKPFVEMMMQRGKSQASIYRFNQYPGDYLYHWERPLWGLPIAQIAKTLSKQRTLTIVVSDAGAASPLYQEERVIRIGEFLDRLLPLVRDVVWINPLPAARWQGTTAEPIALALAGRMVFLELANWQRISRTKQFKARVQLSFLALTEAEFDDDDDDWLDEISPGEKS